MCRNYFIDFCCCCSMLKKGSGTAWMSLGQGNRIYFADVFGKGTKIGVFKLGIMEWDNTGRDNCIRRMLVDNVESSAVEETWTLRE